MSDNILIWVIIFVVGLTIGYVLANYQIYYESIMREERKSLSFDMMIERENLERHPLPLQPYKNVTIK